MLKRSRSTDDVNMRRGAEPHGERDGLAGGARRGDVQLSHVRAPAARRVTGRAAGGAHARRGERRARAARAAPRHRARPHRGTASYSTTATTDRVPLSSLWDATGLLTHAAVTHRR